MPGVNIFAVVVVIFKNSRTICCFLAAVPKSIEHGAVCATVTGAAINATRDVSKTVSTRTTFTTTLPW